jgi:hypothetical protein
VRDVTIEQRLGGRVYETWDDGTTVDWAVEHRGWEALTEEQLREDCAAPGGYRSGAYAAGWTRVLELSAAAVEGAATGEEGDDR